MCEDGLYVWEWFGCVRMVCMCEMVCMCGNGLDV